MIQIRFCIKTGNTTKVKTIQFSKHHEKDFHALYGRIRESIERKGNGNLEQMMLVCCFYIVQGIRQKTITNSIRDKILTEFPRYDTKQLFKDIKNISIEARIDRFPKKILHLAP